MKGPRTTRGTAHDILLGAAELADERRIGGCKAIECAHREIAMTWGPRSNRFDMLDEALRLVWQAFNLFRPPRPRCYWWGNPARVDPQPRILALLLAARIVMEFRDAD